MTTYPSATPPRLVGRVVHDACEITGPAGVVWALAEPGRQLDANLLHLAARQHIDAHVETDLDVLVFVAAGNAPLHTESGDEPLAPNTIAWLPAGSRRALTAGAAGLTYLTVHRRRPGLAITARPST